MVVQIAFLILHKIFPLENALTEMTLRKFVYLFKYIHCNIKDRQILCKLEYGCPFSVFVNLYRKNKFYFYSTSKYILIPVQSNHPNCPASPEKEDQRAAGRPAALTQLALCLRLASNLRPKADNAPSTLNDSTRQ